MNAPELIEVMMRADEVELLYRAALDRDDLERADLWAGLLLRRNDPINQDPTR